MKDGTMSESANSSILKIKEFVSSAAIPILVGMDDISNDALTFRIGKANDLWFHVHGAPGSHVLLQTSQSSTPADKTSIQEAAQCAAWYSKMRLGGKVPVRYGLVQHVRKPRGAKPGMVTIHKEKTIIVRPRIPFGQSDDE
jgi:predicted ribosome quality control (RQC) complex YloA/Tae2 family protein